MSINEDRLARMERRQEMVIQAINGQTDVLRINNALTQEILDLLKQPPSSNVAEMIATLVTKVDEIQISLIDLPATVARAVIDGTV